MHMAGKQTIKGDICKSYLKKYPKMPIRTLASLIYSENDGQFNDFKHAYDLLRYHSGTHGKKNRERAVSKELFRKVQPANNILDDMPKSFAAGPAFYDLPTTVKEVLLLSDIHMPYHDEDALRAAIEKGVADDVDCVILNGDSLDFHWLSSFDKDPSKPKMREELEQGRWLIKALRQTFPNAQIYFKVGNHEARLEKWLRHKAPEWIGTDEFELKILLGFAEHKVHIIESNTIIRAGELYILHGHEYKGAGTVNPARNLYLKAKSSAICGHFHRKSEFLTKDIGEVVHGAWTTGCLCELNPEYMPKGNDWVHGFARISLQGNKKFTVKNYTIISGEVH